MLPGSHLYISPNELVERTWPFIYCKQRVLIILVLCEWRRNYSNESEISNNFSNYHDENLLIKKKKPFCRLSAFEKSKKNKITFSAISTTGEPGLINWADCAVSDIAKPE